MGHIPAKQLDDRLSSLYSQADELTESIENEYDKSTKEGKLNSLARINKMIDQYEEFKFTAPMDFVEADNLEGDSFAGYWNDVMREKGNIQLCSGMDAQWRIYGCPGRLGR